MRRRAGDSWVERGLVFCTRQGSALDAANVQRSFRPSRERDRLYLLARLGQRQLIGGPDAASALAPPTNTVYMSLSTPGRDGGCSRE
jgi:hypothetical protein